MVKASINESNSTTLDNTDNMTWAMSNYRSDGVVTNVTTSTSPQFSRTHQQKQTSAKRVQSIKPYTTMNQFSTFRSCILLFLISGSYGFVVRPVPSAKVLKQSAEPVGDAPSWIDLPRPQKETAYRDTLPSIEIVVGRVAMVGALSLFFNELTTGASISEQVMNAIGMS